MHTDFKGFLFASGIISMPVNLQLPLMNKKSSYGKALEAKVKYDILFINYIIAHLKTFDDRYRDYL